MDRFHEAIVRLHERKEEREIYVVTKVPMY